MELLIILMTASGICFGLQHKLPFLHGKTEFTDKMLACTYCTGFHAGWISYLLWSLPQQFVVQHMLGMAFGSAMFCYALDEWTKYLEEIRFSEGDE